jgi:hypothetical protein
VRRTSHAANCIAAAIESLETRTLLSDAPPVLGNVGGTRSFEEGGPAIAVDSDLTVTDPDTPTLDGASVTIGAGFAAGEDLLGFTPVAGITGSYNAGSGVLTFTGVAPTSDYQTILRSVTYSNTSGSPSLTPRTVTITLSAGPLFNPVTGHFYNFINRRLDGTDAFGISWTQARAEAADPANKLFGLQGYLATMTSAQENDFAASKLLQTGWMGGSDAAVEGEWRWVTGPEGFEEGGQGQQFWQGEEPFNGGHPVAGRYSNWNVLDLTAHPGSDDEPNNQDASGENFTHMIFDETIGARGTWNDLANFGPFPPYIPFGYLIEWGGMPGDPVLQLSGSVTIKINNGPPTITSFTTSSPDCGDAAAGDAVTVTGTFTDSALDTHTATIDWGDGTTTPGTIVEAGGNGTVSGSHAYASGGIFTVTLTVTDDSGASASRTAPAVIGGVGVLAGQLQIIGTDQADHVTVNRTGNGVYKVHDDFLNSGEVDVPAAGITSILAVLCAGDDQFTTAGSIDVLTIVDGGEGNDSLDGPNGGGILIGGPGNDQLNGGWARDLLIGGDGADRIVANKGDDLIVAGTTLFDSNYAALPAVRTGAIPLNDTNTFDDGDLDVLTGSAGVDTFLFNKDGGGVLDKVTDDAENVLDID